MHTNAPIQFVFVSIICPCGNNNIHCINKWSCKKKFPLAYLCLRLKGKAGKLLVVAVFRIYLTGSVNKMATITTDQRQKLCTLKLRLCGVVNCQLAG